MASEKDLQEERDKIIEVINEISDILILMDIWGIAHSFRCLEMERDSHRKRADRHEEFMIERHLANCHKGED